jgi:TRAP-type C4-dicarboxylate transport system permease small subunit
MEERGSPPAERSKRLPRIYAAVGALASATRWLAGLVLAVITAYTLIEVALRLAGHATSVVVEFVGYSLAAMTFLAASATMREGGMVRVGILLARVPPNVHRALDTFCLICTIATLGLVAWFVGRDMLQSYERSYETDSLLPLPSWLPPLPLFLGLIAFLVDMLLHLVLVVRGQARLSDDSPDVI